jgi:O-antigen/teichoic acid export membrane protein
MLRFGFKGLLGSASPLETFRLDQAVIGLFISEAALGIYIVATGFTNLIRFLSSSIGSIVYTQTASLANQSERMARRTMFRFLALTMFVCSAIAIGVALTAGWLVPVLFGPDFSGAVPVTRIVMLAAVLLAGRRILSEGARGLGRPVEGTIGEVVSLISLPIALAIFVPKWGVEGAAWSLVLASCAGLVTLGQRIGLRTSARLQ